MPSNMLNDQSIADCEKHHHIVHSVLVHDPQHQAIPHSNPHISPPKQPPDALLRCHIHMTALKNNHTKAKSLSPMNPCLEWNVPELHWHQSDNNTWLPPSQSSTSSFDNWNTSDPSTHASTFNRDNLQVTRMSISDHPKDSTSNTNQQFNNDTSSFIKNF